MYDRREAILAQLEVILGNLSTQVAPFAAVFRDRADLKDTARPAVVLLDAGEATVQEYGRPTRNGFMAPHLIELRPQIFAVLKVREKEKSSEYGPELSAYRMAILSALSNDEMLRGLIGANGKLSYRGSDTDMQTGSSMQGQFQMNFGITYVLKPEDLL